jgi:hypothetical protein
MKKLIYAVSVANGITDWKATKLIEAELLRLEDEGITFQNLAESCAALSIDDEFTDDLEALVRPYLFN